MYSNSKEQISLEEAYRMVHNEETEEKESCGCGGEEECTCKDHCDKCDKSADECTCEEKSVEEALDFDTISQAAHTVFKGYKEIYDAFLSNPEFRNNMLTYWVGPPLITTVAALAKKGLDKGSEMYRKYTEKKDNAEKDKLIKELLNNNNVVRILEKLQEMQNHSQEANPQWFTLQKELASEIEGYLKKHSPNMTDKVRSGNVWSTYRKNPQPTFNT